MSSQAQPLMVFPKEGLDLRDLPKGDLKTSEVLIRNPSQQTQLWHAKVSGVNWLKLSPSEGTLKPDDARAIDVSIDTNNLVIGNQRVMLTFTSEVDKSSAEVQVPVTLNIIQPIPAIDISNIPIPAPDHGQPGLA